MTPNDPTGSHHHPLAAVIAEYVQQVEAGAVTDREACWLSVSRRHHACSQAGRRLPYRCPEPLPHLSGRTMSFASALNILRPTLPYYHAITQYGLLRITKERFEYHHHPAAPLIALEMVDGNTGRGIDVTKVLPPKIWFNAPQGSQVIFQVSTLNVEARTLEVCSLLHT